MSADASLRQLDRLIGSWITEATHPAMPGVIVRGTAEIQWLEGERFLIHRARNDHPDFPDSISIIGIMGRDRVEDPRNRSKSEGDGLRMHYFDSRGVFRVYEASVDDNAWRLWRDATGFSQRFTGAFAEQGDAIVGRWELNEDDQHWTSDLEIDYRRVRL